MTNPFDEYLKALNKCCDAVKLTAFYTSEVAKETSKTADYTGLSAFYIQEATKHDKAPRNANKKV